MQCSLIAPSSESPAPDRVQPAELTNVGVEHRAHARTRTPGLAIGAERGRPRSALSETPSGAPANEAGVSIIERKEVQPYPTVKDAPGQARRIEVPIAEAICTRKEESNAVNA